MINRRILLLKTVDWQKVLLVGSNANNGSNAGLSYFNSANSANYTSTRIGFRTLNKIVR